MNRRFAFAAVLPFLLPVLLACPLSAQSTQEFERRRMQFATRVPDGVIVVLGAREPAQDYLSFSQAPSFNYLTGFEEPDAALVMVKKGVQVAWAMMFVQPKLPSREVWTGVRLGVRGVTDLTSIRGRVVTELPAVLDSLARTGMAFNVVGQFGATDGPEGSADVRSPDEQMMDALQKKYAGLKVTPVNDLVEELRGTKSPAELALIRRAADITVRAQKEAIAALKDGMNEFEIQALIEYTFRRNGADRPSFATIVGSGPNATTLHYNANDRFIGINDLVVMDIGASYKGYAADVTRTVPASGKFSPTQREVYTIVRDAQAAAERQAKLGAPSRLMNDSANAVIAAGLARLRLIDSPDATYDCSTGASPRQCPQYRMYYMHGLGHGIGLEVHDPEQYYYTAKLGPGSAFTLEPGIYVRERVLDEMPDTPRNREIAARLRPLVTFYRNIGVRIEDDYVVTEQGVEGISRAPREIAEIEALMKAGSTGPAPRDRAFVEGYKAP
ncbi:MAG: Xaa-Pro aminopeptidase [Gemmatimonadaceae bacterium]|nr:Xaa-Pro aminopeptidase [Gemmatimonadaceae bacterium]